MNTPTKSAAVVLGMVGQAWSVRLSDNGVLLWSRTASTGETCTAVVVFPG